MEYSDSKNQVMTIQEILDRMNDETSLEAGNFIINNHTKNISWISIIFIFFRTFAYHYIYKLQILKGVDGLILSRLAAIKEMVTKMKVWEYQMRGKSPGSKLPPVSEEEILIIKKRYSG
ncbi:MAG: hypothetical protein HY964_04975 [Ignavibacteriales bacterium]|nr:hypothetical protein [Ignavibacteriales bacterium]